MSKRVALAVEVPGVRIAFDGEADLYAGLVLGLLEPLARGGWRAGGAPTGFPSPAGPPAAVPGGPGSAPASPAAAAPVAPAAGASAASVPGPAPMPAAARSSPPPPPRAASPGAAEILDSLYAALANEGGRRAERDAALLALLALAAGGKRDATPAEIVAHLSSRGYPAGDLKPRPILAKLCHRKGMAAPGILPHTFRATPAGTALILRRAREG